MAGSNGRDKAGGGNFTKNQINVMPKIFIHCFSSLLFCALFTLSACQQEVNQTANLEDKSVSGFIDGVQYEAGDWAHPEYGKAFTTLGNHRFELETQAGDTLVQVSLPWRRHDAQFDQKKVVIVAVDAEGQEQEVWLLKQDRITGHLLFRSNPEQQRYFAYYLPHESTGGYYPKVKYLHWAAENRAPLPNVDINALPKAKVIRAQSIDDFHSFYPMELIASGEEVSGLLDKTSKAFHLFPEYRDYPIAMSDYLPYRWVELGLKNTLQDEAMRGESFTFQVGIYSPNKALNNLEVQFDPLQGPGMISEENLTCFNTEGIDLNGQAFSKSISVPADKVQALWFGVEIPEDAAPGTYRSWVKIGAEGQATDSVELVLNVQQDLAIQRGENEPEKMTRLRWLNSTLGTDSSFIVPPFTPLKQEGDLLNLLGREIRLAANGLPAEINSYFSPELTFLEEEGEAILAAPIQMEVLEANGAAISWDAGANRFLKTSKTQMVWENQQESPKMSRRLTGTLEYDGMLQYEILLLAKEQIDLADIRLSIPYAKDAANYILGLGEKGSFRPKNKDWKWDVNFHHEGLWLGNVHKGLQYVLRDERYERPLNTNFYHNKPLILPSSWGNEGKGGIRIREKGETVLAENYSGARTMEAGDSLFFNIRFLITPFKPIDTKAHFSTRFVHKYVPVDTALSYGGTVINVHHANEINPYINYPFYNLDLQKAYIDEAHQKGAKVKLYNTIRELTYKAHEIFPMRSLGDEIFNDGEGGGHGWLQEHLVSNYHSAWHATRVNDAAILNKGTSRWTNYYIEGLNWLAKNQEIDGLYLDDIAFSRETVKRISSVLHEHRDEVVIDLHSANQYNERDGYINSVFLYMEHIPYVTRLWFGEYFDYAADPDYWMTEVAGLPFGIPGEMLEKGGHPYRGMVYGMTTRVYGIYDPSGLWRLFDQFGIAESRMLGYWVENVPLKVTERPSLKSTLYLHEDRALLAIGSWSDQDQRVGLEIDWETLGWKAEDYQVYAPAIDDLQAAQDWELNKKILIPAEQGLILVINKR